MKLELVAPCHFGLEAVLKKEIQDLGYEITKVEDGRVFFSADEEGIARGNLFLRSCERLLLLAGEFEATSFEELFEKTKALCWEQYIPADGKFWVKKASSVSSKLFSPSDIQRIVKKAVVEKLKLSYHKDWFEESGAEYPLRVFIHKDRVLMTIDTTGESLHKRGYRALASKAPISETLASALIALTPWKKDRILVDPFCGSGTFPIEAAMMACKIAPGMNRRFLGQTWQNLMPEKLWQAAFEEAHDQIEMPDEMDIQGYDIDPQVIKVARHNARLAGVEKYIHFQQRDVKDLSHPKKYGFLITNPPYGERLEEKKDLPELYRIFGERFRALDCWSAFFITAYEDAQKYFGGKATKNRKIYNGMIKTYFYQYMGPKPR